MSRRSVLLWLVVLAGILAEVAIAQQGDDGVIGPGRRLLGNGRLLTPYGKTAPLGNFPTGGRVTPNGRFLWTVSTGRGPNDVRIVSVRTGKVLQTLPLPGPSGGIAMAPSKPLVYVSGVHDSSHKLEKSPPGTPGIDGDVVHVFSYSTRFGKAKFEKVIPVPPPSDAPAAQNFPPATDKLAWPDRLAVSPDGSRLLVPLNLADAAAIVDTSSGAVKYVDTGDYPYGAAILPDGKTGLVSNETPGTVSVIDLDAAKKIKDITVGAHLSHPEAIAVDPKADRAYVTVTNSDEVAVIDTKAMTVQRTLADAASQGLGVAPVDVSVTLDGGEPVVANEGTDDLSVYQLPGGRLPGEPRKAKKKAKAKKKHRKKKHGKAHSSATAGDFKLIGRIPTSDTPTAVDTTAAAANPCGTRTGSKRGK